MNLSHRTERGHDRAVSQAAAGAGRPIAQVKATNIEGLYGEAMLAMTMREGHKPKRPKNTAKAGPKPDDIVDTILDILVIEMTPSEIAKIASRRLGRRVWPQTVADRLRGVMRNRGLVQSRSDGLRVTKWSKA